MYGAGVVGATTQQHFWFYSCTGKNQIEREEFLPTNPPFDLGNRVLLTDSVRSCVGVQPLAVGISNLVPQLTANAWLADDANIVGKPEDVSRAYKYIKAEGPKYGYVLNESKSKIYAPGIDLRANDLATLFPVDIPRNHAKGIKMLGGLVSKDGPFVTEYLKNLMKQNEVAMLNCAALDDAQASYLILRDSLGFSK